MSDLLKSAIADAKAVRETAIQNAKVALEEAFEPTLQSMLSAKLREEEDEEDVEVPDEDEEEEELPEQDEEDIEVSDDEDEEDIEISDDEEELPEQDEEDVEVSDEDEEDELEFEAIIKELEDEIVSEDDDEEDEEIADDDLEEDIVYEIDDSLFEQDDDEDEEEEEELPEQDEFEDEEDEEEIEELKKELKDHKEAVRFLRDKLREVNILNAKLLFTNKLFKEFTLDNEQKYKIVETFDRAQTVREIKLVYTTLSESFKGDKVQRKSRLKESASFKIGGTKPSKESRKVITEEAQVAERFRKLAGLIR